MNSRRVCERNMRGKEWNRRGEEWSGIGEERKKFNLILIQKV